MDNETKIKVLRRYLKMQGFKEVDKRIVKRGDIAVVTVASINTLCIINTNKNDSRNKSYSVNIEGHIDAIKRDIAECIKDLV